MASPPADPRPIEDLETILHAGRVGTWDWLVDTQVVYYSEEFKELLGFEPSELSDSFSTWQELAHPDDVPLAMDFIDAHFTGRNPDQELVIRLRHKDGDYRWFIARGRIAETHDDGSPKRFVGTATDVTALKQAIERVSQLTVEAAQRATELEAANYRLQEEALQTERAMAELRKSEQRWQFALEGAGDGVWEVFPQTGASTNSRRWNEMLGYDPANPPIANVQDWFDLIHPEDIDVAREAVRRHIEDGQPFHCEYRIRRADGTYCWVLSRGNVVATDGEGRPTHIIGTQTDISARVEAQAALMESQRRLKHVIRVTHSGYWEVFPAENRVEMSPELLDLMGVPDLAGNPDLRALLRERIHPDDREHNNLVMLDVIEGRTDAYYNEFRVMRNDGTYRWFMARGSVVERGPDGMATHLVGATIDITERRESENRIAQLSDELRLRNERLEELNRQLTEELAQRRAIEGSLRESEDRYRRLFELSPEGILVIERNRIQYVNPSCARLLGYDGPDEMHGLATTEFVHESYHDALRRRAEASTHESWTDPEERILVRKDGGLVEVETIGQYISDGESEKLLVMLRDVSDRRRVERALRIAEERWQFALEGTQQGVWDWDPVLNKGYYSDRWAEMLGYTPGELEVDTVEQFKALVHPDDVEQAWARQMAHYRGETPFYEAEFRMKCKDGSWKWVLSRGKVVDRASDGTPLRYVGTHTDVSQRRSQEQEIRRLNEQLAAWAAQLEATNREMEAFSYSVSHDLRGPLRGIDGYSFALMEDYQDQLPTGAQEFVNRIRANVKRMSQLIDDLLGLSRVTRREMHREPVDLTAMAEEVCRELSERYRHPNQTVTIEPEMSTFGDPNLIRILLENLFTNAYKFSSTEPHSIIEMRKDMVDGEPCFLVRDNGIGFDPAFVHKLFQPFERLHQGDQFDGHGIGLAIIDRIVKRHGGRCWAEGRPGEGATFRFTLYSLVPDPLVASTASPGGPKADLP